MGDIDLKLDKFIEIFDLVKKLSWGAIPLWFSLTLPVIYIAYKKLLPGQGTNPFPQPQNFWQRVRNWIALPQLDNYVVYFSLFMFITGTITVFIDQRQRENTRNNGLRIKEYLLSENTYSVSRSSLTATIRELTNKKIDRVLVDYPSEFIETNDGTILLMDSSHLTTIVNSSVKLLDSYLSDAKVITPVSMDNLFKVSPFFTRRIVYKLIMDSGFKYRYCLNGNVQEVDRVPK